MKTLIIVTFLTVLASLTVTAQTQEKKLGMNQNHMQMMMTVKDSSMMDMMMSHVASDRHMRMRMMEKIAEYTEKDTTSMLELCAVMMKGKGEHAGDEGAGCCAMKHDTMQGTTGEPEKMQHKKGSHEKSPKH